SKALSAKSVLVEHDGLGSRMIGRSRDSNNQEVVRESNIGSKTLDVTTKTQDHVVETVHNLQDGSQSVKTHIGRIGRHAGAVVRLVRNLGLHVVAGDAVDLRLERSGEGTETLQVNVGRKHQGPWTVQQYRVLHEASGAYTFIPLFKDDSKN